MIKQSPSSPQGMYLTTWWISLNCSLGTKTPSPPPEAEDGDYVLSTSTRPQTGWNHKVDDWDSWNTTLWPHHQTSGRKSWTLQPSPSNVTFKNAPLKTTEEFRSSEHELPVLLAGPCNKCCTFLHNLLSEIGFAVGEWTQVQFGNTMTVHLL